MRYAICILLVCAFKALLSQELDIKYNEIENKVVKRKLVEAKLGKDIYAPGLTTIVLDASASTPQNGSLTYEWSFPPNMIYIDEYKFNDSDTPVRYENLADDRPSLKMLTTRNKFIEVDPPIKISFFFAFIIFANNSVALSIFSPAILDIGYSAYG